MAQDAQWRAKGRRSCSSNQNGNNSSEPSRSGLASLPNNRSREVSSSTSRVQVSSLASLQLLRRGRRPPDGNYPYHTRKGALDQRGQTNLPLQAHGLVVSRSDRIWTLENDRLQSQQVRDGERARRRIGSWIRRS